MVAISQNITKCKLGHFSLRRSQMKTYTELLAMPRNSISIKHQMYSYKIFLRAFTVAIVII